MSVATVTSKGQITIPKDIREKLNLRSGDKINFLMGDDGRVLIAPATKSITALKGIVSKPGRSVTLEEMDDTVKHKGGAVAGN